MASRLPMRVRRSASAKSGDDSDMTAGYSGTPLAKKLGIRNGSRLLPVNPPDNYAQLLEPLPEDLVILEATENDIDLAHLFTNSRDELCGELAKLRRLIKQDGTIWVSWYKKSGKTPDRDHRGKHPRSCLPVGPR